MANLPLTPEPPAIDWTPPPPRPGLIGQVTEGEEREGEFPGRDRDCGWGRLRLWCSPAGAHQTTRRSVAEPASRRDRSWRELWLWCSPAGA